MNILDPADIALTGRHLIEASAGTGKTFNITRIYLRALLEKERNVQSILVLTFTEAATDELKQRIAEYIQYAVEFWWDTDDEFLVNIQQRIDKQHGYNLLKLALVDMDEAAIFTIHGFCQRLLTQYSTSFGYSSDAEVVIDVRSALLNFISDSLIRWRADNAFFEQLEINGLATPEAVLHQFHDLFFKKADVEVVNATELCAELKTATVDHWHTSIALRQQAAAFINRNKRLFLDGLAQTKKNEETIFQQLEELTLWLTADENSFFEENTSMFADAVTDADNKKAEKCIIHPLLNTLFETRKKKYQQDFAAQLTQIYKPLKTTLLSGLRADGSVILNQSNKLPIYSRIATEVLSIKKQLSRYLDEHKRISFDYMIEKVASILMHDKSSDLLISAIGQQFPMAMIDEFQDTDAQQYGIIDSLFPPGSKDKSLILIGDPKQAIYAFRGGDIFTYINAKSSADTALTMDVNWRSSFPMINAVNSLFKNVLHNDLGPTIQFQSVSGSKQSKAEQRPLLNTLNKSRVDDALHFVFSNNNEIARTAADEYSQKITLIHWMAGEIIALLNQYVFENAEDETTQPLQPKDIAILVRTGYEASLIRHEFKKYNLETVYLSERTPLFSTSQARDLLLVLDAILNIEVAEKLRAGIATGLFRTNEINDVDQILLDDSHKDWQHIIRHIVYLKSIWFSNGLYALVCSIMRTSTPPAQQVERTYANLIHLAEELAQLEITVEDPFEQYKWLKHQITHADTSSVELRLESDKALIKIVTMHKAKGLEYPVVFVPFANTGARFSKQSIYPHHDKNNHLKITLGYSKDAAERAKAEYLSENMRLLYVALTRSLYRCYLGILVSNNASTSSLNRLLSLEKLNNEVEGNAFIGKYEQAITLKCSEAKPNIVMTKATIEEGGKYSPAALQSVLSFKTASRKVNPTWQMSSFSRMSLHSESSVILHRENELEQPNDITQIYNEQRERPALQTLHKGPHEALAKSTEHLRFALQPGATSGNLLHDMLENLNFSSPNYTEAWEQVKNRHTWFGESDLTELAHWLDTCLETPILSNACSLGQLKPTDVLKEPGFYMPSLPMDSLDVTRMLVTHRQKVSSIYSTDTLVTPQFSNQQSNMIVQGFVDLIFLFDDKYYVVDYKSSFLGNSFADYSKQNMWENIQSHSYDLQYHLYALALHRLLGQRINNYTPDVHLGGVIYLYLRGMHPEHRGTGVFFVPVSALCLDELNSLMDDNE